MDTCWSEYSDGLLTGAKPVTVTGKDEVNYTILQIEVAGNPENLFHQILFPSAFGFQTYNRINLSRKMNEQA